MMWMLDYAFQLAVTCGCIALGLIASFCLAMRCKLGSFKASFEQYQAYLTAANDNQRYSGLIMNEKNHPHHFLNIATSWFRCVPNVFIAGTMKGGTTTLHDWLSQSPCVIGGISKEAHFFDARSIFGDWVFSQPVATQRRLLASFFPTRLHSWFCRLFYGSQLAVVESTPINLYFGEWVAPHIKAVCPDAKIIHILRDPVERLRSHYNFGQKWGYDDEYTNIEDAIKAEPRRHPWEEFRKACCQTGHIGGAAKFGGAREFAYHSYAARGYYKGVDHFVKAFGAENVLIVTLDELSSQPQETMDKVFSFLGLDPVQVHALPKNTTKSYKASVRVGQSLSLEMEVALRQRYFSSNQRLFDKHGVQAALLWNAKLRSCQAKLLAEQQTRAGNIGVMVTGFKRSGTSCMMEILRRIGFEPHFDERFEQYLRTDYAAENPYFYEDPNVVHSGICEEALAKVVNEGRSFKCFTYGINPTIKHAAAQGKLKVVMMRRNQSKISSSISVYKKEVKPGHRTKEEDFKVLTQTNFGEIAAELGALQVSYDDLVDDPEKTVQSICNYLGKTLDVEHFQRVCAVVDRKKRHH